MMIARFRGERGDERDGKGGEENLLAIQSFVARVSVHYSSFLPELLLLHFPSLSSPGVWRGVAWRGVTHVTG